MERSATYWIQKLSLEPHPEGGYYRQTYSSDQVLNSHHHRPISTAIYYLLAGSDFSAFHRLKSDEMWHCYDTNTHLRIHCLYKDTGYQCYELGLNAPNQHPQQMISSNTWFAAELAEPKDGSYALIGCTVSPGFHFDDFELATTNGLQHEYPQYSELIGRLTR